MDDVLDPFFASFDGSMIVWPGFLATIRGEMHDRIIRMLRRHNVAVAAV